MKQQFYFLPFIWMLLLSLVQFSAIAQKPVLSLQNGHNKNVTHLEISVDSKFILSAAADNTAKLWDSKTGKLLQTFAGHNHFVSAALFAGLGNKAYTASWDKSIKQWDLYTGKCLKTYNCSTQAINTLTISDDQKMLAFSTTDGQVIVLNTETGAELQHFQGAEQIADLAFNSNNKLIAGACSDNVVRIWDVKKGKTVQILKGANGSMLKLKFIPSKSQICALSDDNVVRVWEITKSKAIQTLIATDQEEGSMARLSALTINADGSKIFAASDNGLLVKWNAETGKLMTCTSIATRKLENIVIAPDSSFMITSTNNAINIYPSTNAKSTEELRPVASIVNAVSFSLDKSKLLSASANGYFRVINALTGRIIKSVYAHDYGCENAIFSPDQKYILTCGKDKQIKLWDATSYQVIRLYEGHTDVVTSISFRADGKYFASGSADFSVKFWDTQTGQIMRDFTDHSARVSAVVVSIDGTSIASASADKTIKIWNIQSNSVAANLLAHTDDVWSVCYSPDGQFLASASGDKTIKLWSTKDYSLLQTLEGHTDYVFKLAFSADSKQLASAAWDKTIRVWDLQSMKSIQLVGHQNYVRSATFSEDGKWLVSGGNDSQIKIWNVSTGQELLNYVALDSEQDFVITTTNGLFDGTEKGIRSSLHYVQAYDVLPLESFYEKCFSPDLWRNVLSSQIKIKPDINTDNPLRMPPLVKYNFIPGELTLEDGIYQTSKQELNINVEATDMGGGIDEIRMYLNGKLCETTSRGFKLVVTDGEKKTKKFSLMLSNGENVLKATAFNKDRTESVPISITINYNGTPTAPDLYVISIGINRYKNESMNLNYASADAHSFEESLKIGAKSIFKQIVMKTLTDDQFTKINVETLFRSIASNAKPEDVFVFYYAGHGVIADDAQTGKPEFYIVPYDVTQLYGNEDVLSNKGISSAQLQELIKNVKAQKQLIVLDACQSGGAVEFLATRGSVEQKAIVQLARSAGVAVLAASGSEQLATEVAELGHGIFTYALVEALSGKADPNMQNKKITVNQIRSYLEDRVPELTQKYRGKPQFPTAYCKGQDFPISIGK